MLDRMDLTAQSYFRIAEILVLPPRCLIVRDGVEIPLEQRVMELLVCLAERAPETISPNELMDEVWRTRVYGKNSLQAAINRLRNALGDEGRKPGMIKTVIGSGYCVIAPVSFPAGYQPRPRRDQPWGPEKDSPYMGLAAYDEAHAKVFHGRRTLTGELLEAMRSQLEQGRRLVLIDGPSGCGKSSILRAGAIPQLTSTHGMDGMCSLAVASCNLAAMTDGDAIGALAAAMASLTLDERAVFPMHADELKAFIAERPARIDDFIEEAFRRHRDRKKAQQHLAHMLLVIDHAEALVPTEHPDAEMLSVFVRILCALCGNAHMLVTMICRRDAYPRLIDAMPELKELKAGKGHVEVFAPRGSEIVDIITRPAAQASLRFEEKQGRLDNIADDHASYHPRLLKGRLDHVLYEAANAHPDALPLLQHTLQSLYERKQDGLLTFAAYDTIGGLEGAIGHRAEEAFLRLPQDAQEALDQVLRRLVISQPGSDVISIRRAYGDTLPDAANALVQSFIHIRLFVGGSDAGRPNFGIVHEALLRRWPRAERWVEENRRLLRAKSMLEQAAEHWNRIGRSPDHLLPPGPLGEAREAVARLPDDIKEQEYALLRESTRVVELKRRLRRMGIALLGLLTITSTTLAVVAMQARDNAERRGRETQQLAEYLVGPLAIDLRDIGKLEILGRTGRIALDYLQNRKLDELNERELVSLARASLLLGEAFKENRDPTTARSAFNTASQAATLAVQRNPLSEDAIEQAGYASFWLGNMALDERKFDEARRHWTHYMDNALRLLQLSPGDPDWIMEGSYALNCLGTLYLRQGKPEMSMPYFRVSESVKRSLVSAYPGNHGYELGWIDSLSWMSSTLEAEGNIQEASSGYRNQIAKLRTLMKKDKDLHTYRLRLANFLQLSASVEMAKGDVEAAYASATESVQILSRLNAFDPANSGWAKDLVRGKVILGDIAGIRSGREEKRRLFESALALIPDGDINGESRKVWQRLDAYIKFALAQDTAENHADAEAHDAIAKMRKLADESKSDEVYSDYAWMLIARGRKHQAASEPALAKQDWEGALAVLSACSAKHRADWLYAWVTVQLLLGRKELAQPAIARLRSIGFRHPEFVQTIRSMR